MTKTSLIGLVVILGLVPFACGDDETTSSSTSTTASTSNAASTTAASSTQSAGGSGGSMAVGGMGGGMGEGGGTSSDACEMCIDPLVDGQGACVADVEACMDDATCEMWADCYDECFNNDFTATCFSDCDTMYQSASNLYTPLVTCICGGCSGPCSPVCS